MKKVSRKKALFSALFGALVGVCIVWILFGVGKKTNTTTPQVAAGGFPQEDGMLPGSGAAMPMRGDILEQLGMTQEELDAELAAGKTMRDIMEENNIQMPAFPQGTGARMGSGGMRRGSGSADFPQFN